MSHYRNRGGGAFCVSLSHADNSASELEADGAPSLDLGRAEPLFLSPSREIQIRTHPSKITKSVPPAQLTLISF